VGEWVESNVLKKLSVLDMKATVSCGCDFEKAKKWLDGNISNGTLFSFKYNGKSFSEIMKDWKTSVSQKEVSDGVFLTTAEYISPEKIKVVLSAYFYPSFGALDWRLDFYNESKNNSPVISDILPVNSAFSMKTASLMTANGCDKNDVYDFAPIYVDLNEKHSYEASCKLGRSSQGALPFFDVMDRDSGIIGAIGWTGQWYANFSFDNGYLRIKAGMSETRISLYPNESMRSPSMVLCFFNGNRDFGHNLLRKLIMNRYSPPDENGKPLTHLPLFMAVHCPMGEKKVVEQIEKCEKNGIEYEVLWMDAGWSGKMYDPDTDVLDWYHHTGDWYINPKIYPGNGFSDISKLLKSYRNTKLLVWFEPERAMKNTDVYKTHPNYFLGSTDDCIWEMFDFTNDEAVDYIIDVIDGVIKENGISWYRQDCNLNPNEKWQIADEREGENRVGIHEIKHITNLYRYVDTLIARNPGLVMDNCASGGRRIDIEMLRRSVVLWRTDYTVDVAPSDADGVRIIGANLNLWVPMSCCGAGTDGLTCEYQYRSMQSSGAQIQPIYENDQLYSKMSKQYKRCRQLMGNNYYILAHGQGERYNKENAILEWYDENCGKGFVQVFRPRLSDTTENRIVFKGLNSKEVYKITVEDNRESITVDGETLMGGGIAIDTLDPYSSFLIYIDKIDLEEKP